MAIFKYTLIKYLKSTSTWIVIALSMFIIVMFAGYVAFSAFNAPTKKPVDYGRLAIALVAGITGFMAIFTSVFSGFKAASMFRDEVEDGTFLVLLSKPIRRSKIIFMKWLALQSIIALYTFVVALTFAITLLIFDTGKQVPNLSSQVGLKTLSSQAWIISLYMWMILFVASLIFSSIALLLSTKISLGSTIGISIALGVLIPITSLVSVFTKKNEYEGISNNWIGTTLSSLPKDQIPDVITAAPDYASDPYYIYNLSAKTKVKDSYKKGWIFDINFQFQTLAIFASQNVVPDSVKNLINRQANNAPGLGLTHSVPSTNKYSSNEEKNIQDFNYAIANTWEKNAPLRKLFLTALQASGLDSNSWIYNTILSGTSQENLENIGVVGIKDEKFTPQTWTEFSTQFADIDKKIADGTSEADKTAIYENVNNILKALYAVLDDFTQQNDKIDDVSKAIIYSANMLSQPLSLLLDRFMETYTVKDVIDRKPTSDSVTVDGAKEIKNSMALGVLQQSEIDTGSMQYSNAIAMINDGYVFSKTKQVEYASKNKILYTYLAIAFILVPISYFVVRRQDFR